MTAQSITWRGEPPVDEILAKKLSRGKTLTLDDLLSLSPNEPLMAVEGPDRNGECAIVHEEWTKHQLELARKYPGLQLDYWYREARKYASSPKWPLLVQVRALLDTAKMHWSRAVEAHDNGWGKHWGMSIDCTNKQFKDWLPEYMDQVGNRIASGRWDAAARLVRIACGSPQLAPRTSRKAGIR